jgi:hypothetical protein
MERIPAKTRISPCHFQFHSDCDSLHGLVKLRTSHEKASVNEAVDSRDSLGFPAEELMSQDGIKVDLSLPSVNCSPFMHLRILKKKMERIVKNGGVLAHRASSRSRFPVTATRAAGTIHESAVILRQLVSVRRLC